VSDDGHRGPLLEVEDLEVKFFTRRGVVQAVRGTTFEVARGETVGLVGESGSGKSVTSLAILGLIELPGKITAGDVRWKGASLLDNAGRKRIKQIRGKELAVVFQDPMTSLNPLFTIRAQISEVLRHHLGMRRKQAEERVVELLDLVGDARVERTVAPLPEGAQGGDERAGGLHLGEEHVAHSMAFAWSCASF